MLENTINWYQGEIFEGKMILLFGIIISIIGFILHFWGTTPYAKALFVPMFVLGILLITTGSGMIFTNGKTITQIPELYEKNPVEFILSEIKRVEGFMYLYPTTLTASAVLFLVGVLLLGFTKNIYFHSSAVALVVLGVSLIAIDYFSKERATIYYKKLHNSEVIHRRKSLW